MIRRSIGLMKLPDTNVWLALALSRHHLHSDARDWFAAQSAPASVLFCRATQQSFLRLLTTEKLMQLYGLSPFNNAGACRLMDGFLEDSRISWVSEPPRLESNWRKLAARQTPSPKLWMDAYLAAFALAGGHQLVTTDKAFTQFQDLDLIVLS